MKRKSIGYALGILAILVVLALDFLGILQPLEFKSYDLRLKLRDQQKPVGKVVVAVIDDKILGRIGRWPWDREVHADLIDKLVAAARKCT